MTKSATSTAAVRERCYLSIRGDKERDHEDESKEGEHQFRGVATAEI